MGHYSQLYLDKFYFSWKYEIPSFLAFFFKKEMFYKIEIQDDEGDESYSYFKEIGYKCSAKQSISILENLGYSFNQIIDIYSFFHQEIAHEVYESIFEAIIEKNDDTLSETMIELLTKKHISSFPSLSREEELRDFISFLPQLIKDSHKPNKNGTIVIDLEEIQMYMHGKDLAYPPWIIIISRIFDWTILQEYSEIVAMLYFRLFLEAIPNKSLVRLDLHDIVEEEEKVLDVQNGLATRLIDKINLYNNFFKPLITKEDFIKEKYVKSHGKDLLQACLNEKDSYKKGQYLEQLTEIIFTSNNSLDISSRRVKTGDEEIDLVILNKMTSAFWVALGAMFFVECKNWSTPIGAKEMRDFETKLRNHRNVTLLGFFVSINGFTSEARNHLKRIGREDYHIVLIDKSDIKGYLNSTQNLFEWLEEKVKIIY